MARGRDPNTPYLAVLLERGMMGHARVHAGLARHGAGKTLCSERTLFEFAHPRTDPKYALTQPDGYRHRYVEAYLELNRGCPECLNILAQIAAEVGWRTPKELAV